MKRSLLTVVALVGLLAMLAPPVMAQAPAPKVTINGLVDTITTYDRNLSNEDLNYHRDKDREWYARVRARPDITAEVGTTKFVLGLEIDYAFGSVSANSGKQRFGTTEGSPINTDIGKSATDAGTGILEMKWAYTEFDIPLLPFNGRIRLGAQPFTAVYKVGTLASSDFAGINVDLNFTPEIKWHATWAQINDSLDGVQSGWNPDSGAVITSVEVTPIKGVDLRPIFGFFDLDGSITTSTRQARGGVGTGATVFVPGDHERRYTIGMDSRLRFGPVYIDPTFYYQWGEREQTFTNAGPKLQVNGTCQGAVAYCEQRTAKRSAWFADVRGGFQLGPLLLEGAGIYASGNKAQDDLTNGRTKLKFFEPLTADTSFYTGWAEIWALGIDYFNIIYARASGLDTGVAIGYDKYGLIRFGFRPSYAITPNFSVRAAVTANWTAEKVDTDGLIAAGTGLTPANVNVTCVAGVCSLNKKAGESRPQGDSRYLGTELDLGLTWRFAPNIALDLVGAYNWSGDAMGSAGAVPNSCVAGGNNNGACNPSKLVTSPNNNVKDVQAVTARIRYTF